MLRSLCSKKVLRIGDTLSVLAGNEVKGGGAISPDFQVAVGNQRFTNLNSFVFYITQTTSPHPLAQIRVDRLEKSLLAVWHESKKADDADAEAEEEEEEEDAAAEDDDGIEEAVAEDADEATSAQSSKSFERVTLKNLVLACLIQPGAQLQYRPQPHLTATVLANGELRSSVDGKQYSSISRWLRASFPKISIVYSRLVVVGSSKLLSQLRAEYVGQRRNQPKALKRSLSVSTASVGKQSRVKHREMLQRLEKLESAVAKTHELLDGYVAALPDTAETIEAKEILVFLRSDDPEEEQSVNSTKH